MNTTDSRSPAIVIQMPPAITRIEFEDLKQRISGTQIGVATCNANRSLIASAIFLALFNAGMIIEIFAGPKF